MVYTSETIQGQVYVPAVNWARAWRHHLLHNVSHCASLSNDSYYHRSSSFQELCRPQQCLWVRVCITTHLCPHPHAVQFRRGDCDVFDLHPYCRTNALRQASTYYCGSCLPRHFRVLRWCVPL